MSKFPTSSQRPRAKLNPELLEAVKAFLGTLPKGDQIPELSSTRLEAYLKAQGMKKVRGSELDRVMKELIQDGSIAARKSGIGHWSIQTNKPKF